jgi:hypothetical protein
MTPHKQWLSCRYPEWVAEHASTRHQSQMVHWVRSGYVLPWLPLEPVPAVGSPDKA